MTTAKVRSESTEVGKGTFVGSVGVDDTVRGRAPLARLVTTGTAATIDRRDLSLARGVLVAALTALRERGITAGILVTPAGFIDHKPGGTWSRTKGWNTSQVDFDQLAAIAAEAVAALVTPEVRSLAAGTIEHLIVGVDVWPTPDKEPLAETACLYAVGTGEVRPITGKSYPNSPQENDLIRNRNVGSHVVEVGGERVAVLVCHDLAAWSPRGNAVAKGDRASVWQAMQAEITAGRPTLAVQLPHTVNTAGTWRAAWSRFDQRSGGAFRSGTTAIRHLDKNWHKVATPPDTKLLAGTCRGDRAVDVIVSETPE
jgi:hypothetical protein